jgi:hypothetical protein
MIDFTKANSIIQGEDLLDSLKVSKSRNRIIMLNDMLKYEREKMQEDKI